MGELLIDEFNRFLEMSILRKYIILEHCEITPNRLRQLIQEWRIAARWHYRGLEFGIPTTETDHEELELFARVCHEKDVPFFKPAKKYKRRVRARNWSYEKWMNRGVTP